MAICPQCGFNVDDGGYPEGQLLSCSGCGCDFSVDRIGRKRAAKSCGGSLLIALAVFILPPLTVIGCVGCVAMLGSGPGSGSTVATPREGRTTLTAPPAREDEGEAVVDPETVGEVEPQDEDEAIVETSPARSSLTTSGARYAGRHAARRLLEPSLRSPSTASYPWESVAASAMPDVTEGDVTYQRWRVSGSVDSQNAFGATVRSRWTVIVASDGDTMFPLAALLEDRVVWGNPLYAIETRAASTVPAEDAAEVAEPPEEEKVAKVGREQRPYREWSSEDGTYTVRASLVSFGGGVVKLRREDGREVDVPMERLSDDDQEYLRELMRRR